MNFQTELNSICKPVFDASGLSTFYYARIMKNQDCFVLCNKPDWVNYKLENDFTIFSPVHLSSCNQLTYQLVPRQGDATHTKTMHDAEDFFQIYHPIDVFYQNETYLELFSFAISADNPEVQNWYLNNLSLLNKFVFNIKSKLDNIICSDHVQPVSIANPYQLPALSELDVNHSPFDSSTTSLEVTFQGCKVRLSPRETEISSYVVKGYTSKTIARKLDISHRTVEIFIGKIKQKFGCTTKDELVSLLVSCPFFF